MRINRTYRAARKGGKSARMAGQEVLQAGEGVAALIRDKGMVPMTRQLQKADTAYAQAVANAFGTANRPMMDMMVATPLSDIPGMTAVNAYEAKGGIGPRTAQDQFKGRAADAALMASNIGARYALPAAGVALAAKGIGDVAFGGPADQQEPNQLDVGNVVGTAAVGAGIAAGPTIFNAVRDPKYRTEIPRSKSLGVTAAGAGIGALTSGILQSL